MQRGFFQRLKIKHIIAICALWSLVITQLGTLIPALFLWEGEAYVDVEEDVLSKIRANVDVTHYPNLLQTTAIFERLMRKGSFSGFTLYNNTGDKVQEKGVLPSLTPSLVQHNSSNTWHTSGKAYLDIYYDSLSTGLVYDAIVRVDISHVGGLIQQKAIDRALLILLFSILSTAALASSLGVFVVRPVLKLRETALKATDNPDTAEQFCLNWERGDEIGDAARAFDRLLKAVSLLHQEEQAVALESATTAKQMIVHTDMGLKVLSANDSFRNFFAQNAALDVEFFKTQEFLVYTEKGFVAKTLSAILNMGKECFLITIPPSENMFLLESQTLKKKSGVEWRRVFRFISGEAFETLLKEQASQLDALRLSEADKTRKLYAQKLLFESCMTIISKYTEKGDSAETREEVMSDRILNAWYSEAFAVGLISSKLRHAVLPLVYGDAAHFETVFRQACTLLQARSPFKAPVLEVVASVNEAKEAEFILLESEEAMHNMQMKEDKEQALQSAALCAVSLKYALGACGGALKTLHYNNRNAILFTLPTKQSLKQAA